MKTNKKFLGNQIEGLKKTFGNYEEPYSEIRQTQKGMDIKIKLPEVKKKNITINITETQIEIKAKSKQQKFSKIYHRIIDIPKCSLNKKTKADYKKGVLKIKVPYQKWK